MLYGNDDDEKKGIISVKVKNNFWINKNVLWLILCGICIIVIIICACSIFKSDYANNQVDTENTVENEDIVNIEITKHIQIEQHDIEKIRKKLRKIPKQNENAQTEIKNIYFSEEKVAYLTFDDGPSKDVTPQILDILKQENIPATFFVLGSRVDLYPDIVNREYDEGHYLANHGYSHEYSKIYTSKDTVFEEYIKCENAVRNALNDPEYSMYLFRFPGGSSGGKYSRIKAEAKELLNTYGISHTNWNCLTGDAAGNTTHEDLMNSFINTMSGNGSLIVLMHDANDKTYTVEVLPSVIAYLREQGYTFKNFYEIFR